MNSRGGGSFVRRAQTSRFSGLLFTETGRTIGESGYIGCHVLPDVAESAAKAGRSPADIANPVPVMTIVGDSDGERENDRDGQYS